MYSSYDGLTGHSGVGTHSHMCLPSFSLADAAGVFARCTVAPGRLNLWAVPSKHCARGLEHTLHPIDPSLGTPIGPPGDISTLIPPALMHVLLIPCVSADNERHTCIVTLCVANVLRIRCDLLSISGAARMASKPTLAFGAK